MSSLTRLGLRTTAAALPAPDVSVVPAVSTAPGAPAVPDAAGALQAVDGAAVATEVLGAAGPLGQGPQL